MADILRININGAMPGGEVWSVNPVFKIGGDFGEPVSPAQALTIATAIAAISVPAGLLAINPAAVTVAGVRVEARTVAGVLETQAEAVKGAPQPGTSASGLPFQSALVFSLRTTTPGARGRGRLYWPACGIAMQPTTLRAVSATVGSALTAMASYLTSIRTAIDTSLDGVGLTVWSRASLDTSPVTSIQVGDVVDTQRRRRDQSIETYQSVAFP